MSVNQVSKAEIKKNKNEGRKRFSDEQISFLEYIYETESKPELRMKHQLANKLGLHPRQVAIWFQNKRARSKSRQVEHEFNILKTNYETLALKTESLKKENQILVKQLEMLRNVVERRQESVSFNSNGEESDDRGLNSPTKSDANVMFEDNVPFYDSVVYFEKGSGFLDMEEQLCDLDQDLCKWWEV